MRVPHSHEWANAGGKSAPFLLSILPAVDVMEKAPLEPEMGQPASYLDLPDPETIRNKFSTFFGKLPALWYLY